MQTPSGISPCTRIAETFAAVLAVLLPVKFASIVMVPEMPASYWFDPLSLLFTVWPIHLFSFASALLLLTAALLRGNGIRSSVSAVWTGLWGLLAVLSFAGWIHASCREYAIQMISYAFGTGSYILAVFLLLEHRPGFRKTLFASILLGGFLSAFSGLNQYFTGFDQLEQYVYEQNLQFYGEAVKGQMLTRIREARLQADFAVCNTYAGYLAFLFPLACLAGWHFGETRVRPEKISRWILAALPIPLFLFLIARTGSRGGLLALCAGIAVLCIFLPRSRKARWLSAGFFLLCLSGFFAVVLLGRGFKSMIFRFDYDWAAFRMMLTHPLFGTGWGDFFHDYQVLKLLLDMEAPHTPHNMPLAFGSQCGIPAFLISCVLLLLPLFFTARRLLHSSGTKDRLILSCFLFSFAAALVDFLLEISYETPAFLCTYAALVLILFHRPREAESENPEIRPVSPRVSAAVRVGAVLFALFAAAAAFVMIRDESAHAELQETLDPRYSREMIENRNRTGMPPSPSRVMALLNRAAERGPYNPFPWAMACDYFTATKNFAAAEKMLDQAILRSPKRAAFYLKRAKLRSRRGADPALVSDDLRKVRELFPMNDQYRKTDPELLAE